MYPSISAAISNLERRGYEPLKRVSEIDPVQFGEEVVWVTSTGLTHFAKWVAMKQLRAVNQRTGAYMGPVDVCCLILSEGDPETIMTRPDQVYVWRPKQPGHKPACYPMYPGGSCDC